eukprot:9297129-Alexandrium_andersonii.AAC.1
METKAPARPRVPPLLPLTRSPPAPRCHTNLRRPALTPPRNRPKPSVHAFTVHAPAARPQPSSMMKCQPPYAFSEAPIHRRTPSVHSN